MRMKAAGVPAQGDPKSPRILVIRLRRIGDLLLTTPTLRAIRRAFPSCQLDVLVSAGFELPLAGNPHLDELWVLRSGVRAWLSMVASCRRRHYDIVLDTQSSTRSLLLVASSGARLRVGWRKRAVRNWAYNRLLDGWNEPVYIVRKTLRMAEAIGVPPTTDLRPELVISSADRERVRKLFASNQLTSDRPVVALSVVANQAPKRWSAHGFAELADRLVHTDGAQIVLTSGPGEIEQVRAVVERMHQRPALWNYGTTTLAELGAVYEHCDLWIGNDGAPKHVATAVGCPTLAINKTAAKAVWVDTEDNEQFEMRPLVDDAQNGAAAVVDIERLYAVAHQHLRSQRQPTPGTRPLSA